MGRPGLKGRFHTRPSWLVEALTCAGRTDPARLDDARVLSLSNRCSGTPNDLGLYAEQTGNSGEALGNFPQAFTHLALDQRLLFNLGLDARVPPSQPCEQAQGWHALY